MRLAACTDPLMRAVVLSPIRMPDITRYVRTEFGGCADWVYVALGDHRGDRRPRRPVRVRQSLRAFAMRFVHRGARA